MYTVKQVLEELDRLEFSHFGPLNNRGSIFKRWLGEIWGDEKQVDDCYCRVDKAREEPMFRLLALASKRVWVITLGLNGYDASSFITGDISSLQLKNVAGTVTLKIGIDEAAQEVTATGNDGQRLISLHRQLSA